jgi:hypothetical protein
MGHQSLVDMARSLIVAGKGLFSGGDEAHRSAAQQALLHRARCSSAAGEGTYRVAMELT